MNNVILVGYMGCGKTTVGKNLARACNYLFVDTDEEIEKMQGRTITEIFATDGEAAFRDMETDYLKNMFQHNTEAIVLSTGGGIAVREENRALLQELGIVIYLKAKPETIYERVKGDTKRPLLQCEDPLQKIKEMLKLREPLYGKAANKIIEVDEYRQSQITDMILELFRQE